VLVSGGSMLLVPIAAALVSEMAPTALRGRYMGTWTLVWMTGTALAPIFGGLALEHLGRDAYLVILAVCLLGALLFAVLRSAQADLSAVAKAD
jgi:MFS family permease